MSTVQAFDWNRYAECYDSLLTLTPYTTMVNEVAKASILLPGQKILDASCGTGNFELLRDNLAPNHSPKTLVGVDASSTMLKRAKTKCAKLPYCSFFNTDLNKPLHDIADSFSQIISINTLYAVENPAFTLSEFYKKLTPGGSLLLVTPTAHFENGLILKEHAGSTLPDSFWLDAHASPEREEYLIRTAIADEAIVTDLLLVAAYNRHIAQNTSFHFFSDEEICILLTTLGFTITHHGRMYANQDHFLIASK